MPNTLKLSPAVREAYDLLDTGIVIVDSEFSILFMNQWVRQRLSAERRKAINLEEFYIDWENAPILNYIRRALKYKTVQFLSPVFHRWVIPLPDEKMPSGYMSQRGLLVPVELQNDTDSKEQLGVMLQLKDDSNLVLQINKLKNTVEEQKRLNTYLFTQALPG